MQKSIKQEIVLNEAQRIIFPYFTGRMLQFVQLNHFEVRIGRVMKDLNPKRSKLHPKTDVLLKAR